MAYLTPGHSPLPSPYASSFGSPLASPGAPSRPRTPIPREQTIHLPRILCLHGGGVTAEVFQMQARALIAYLPDFRLVFADGPFFCDAGPGIVPVYEEYAPFRRWLRWLPEHAEIDDESAIEEVLYNIDTCKREDEGDGEWVGMLGFSQGAKLAASLLYDQQIRLEKDGHAPTDYKFAVLLAGRAPLVSFCEHSQHPALAMAGQISEGHKYDGVSPHKVKIPTIHVHGLLDKGLHLHRNMLSDYHDRSTAIVIEWKGDHRVPIKSKDVEPIAEAIYQVARDAGVDV